MRGILSHGKELVIYLKSKWGVFSLGQENYLLRFTYRKITQMAVEVGIGRQDDGGCEMKSC